MIIAGFKQSKLILNRTSFLTSALLAISLLANPVIADSAISDNDAVNKTDALLQPSASIEVGSDAYEFKLGMGEWTDNDTNYGQLYISHFKAKDSLKVSGKSQGKQKYTSTRIGIDVDGFGTDTGKAFQGGVFLYSNKSQANIDRYGLGLAFALGHMLTNEARIHVGFELMPEFLSTDWDAKALFEYEFNAGATYRITPKVDASLMYRYGATLDDINVKHYNQLMAGLSLKL